MFSLQVLHYEVESTGLTLALPYLLSLLVKFIAGPLSDHLTCIGEKTRINIFNFFARGVGGFCFIGLAVVPVRLASLAQAAYTLTITLSGLNSVGTMRSAQLVFYLGEGLLLLYTVYPSGCPTSHALPHDHLLGDQLCVHSGDAADCRPTGRRQRARPVVRHLLRHIGGCAQHHTLLRGR